MTFFSTKKIQSSSSIHTQIFQLKCFRQIAKALINVSIHSLHQYLSIPLCQKVAINYFIPVYITIQTNSSMTFSPLVYYYFWWPWMTFKRSYRDQLDDWNQLDEKSLIGGLLTWCFINDTLMKQIASLALVANTDYRSFNKNIEKKKLNKFQ